MAKTLKHQFSKFLPSEVERITGVTAVKQRDWRRHGHIPGETRTWNEFELPQLAALYVMGALAQVGYGPSKSKEVAEVAAAAVIYRALQVPAAYDPDSNFGPLSKSTAASMIALRYTPFKGVIPGGRFFIVWPDGFWDCQNDVAKGLANPDYADRTGQPFVVLDMQGIAADLLAKAQRPVVLVYEKTVKV